MPTLPKKILKFARKNAKRKPRFGKKMFKKPGASKRLPNKQSVKGQDWIAVMHPPKGFKRPYPDQYYTTISSDFLCAIPAAAIGNGAQSGSFANFVLNSIRQPYNGSLLSNTNSLAVGATGGAAGLGFAAAAVGGYGAGQNLPNATSFNPLYQNYIIYDTFIKVQVDLQASGDACEMTLSPVMVNEVLPAAGAANVALRLAERKGVKNAMVEYAGQGRARNECTLRCRLQDLVGRPTATLEELINDENGVHYWGPTDASANPSRTVGCILGLRTLDGAPNAGTINVRVSMKQKILFYEPVPVANL